MSAPLRVLLVDDEPAVLLTMAANLELEGFDVTTAEDGLRALALVQQREFDVVLSDIRMPGLTGIELFRRIKELRPELPTVLTSAFFAEDQLRQVGAEGVFAIVPKPADVDHLVRLVQRAGRRPTVLVVDDAQPHARSLAEALQAAGIRAEAVFDGPTAIAHIRAGAVDVCVTDLVMPEVDGAKVVEEVRRLDPAVSVIVFSGHAVPEILNRVAAGGVFACLRKPIAVPDLANVIVKARSGRAGR